MLRDQEQKIIIDDILYYSGMNKYSFINYYYYYKPVRQWFRSQAQSYCDGSYYFRIMQRSN